eukprot:3670965-Rhodomonas_salina.1
MVPLVQLLDGRGDVCDAFGAFSADTARFELTEKTLIVMETKLKVAQVLSDLVESGMSERQREFMHFWDKMLSRKFGIQDWASAVASVRTPGAASVCLSRLLVDVWRVLSMRGVGSGADIERGGEAEPTAQPRALPPLASLGRGRAAWAQQVGRHSAPVQPTAGLRVVERGVCGSASVASRLREPAGR